MKTSIMKTLEKYDDRLHSNRRLYQRIYDDILKRGMDFTVEKKDEFLNSTVFLADLMLIHSDYTRERGLFCDLFGDYIEEIGDTNARVGQFFTPHRVCELMTDINISCSNTAPVLLSDPAAGSGRFMLSVAKKYAIKTGKLNFIFVNQDVDFKCFVYSTMNAILNRIPSIHIHGDTLANSIHNAIAVIPQFNLPVWYILNNEQLSSLQRRFSHVTTEKKRTPPDDSFNVLNVRGSQTPPADLFDGLF